MDHELLFIVIASGILFFGGLIWKLRWFYKKMLAAEQQQAINGHNGSDA